MDETGTASRNALEEVTEAAFNGVLAALERRRIDINKFPGPILVGIIAWPELLQGQGIQRVPQVNKTPG
jgi:hypothetical protein